MVAAAPNLLVTTYLEMTSSSQLNASLHMPDYVRIERMGSADTGFYRYLYQSVGEKWRWRDRLYLSSRELSGILTSPHTHIFVLYVSGAPAGYIELNDDAGDVEVAYFGLREDYHGRGLGKLLLSYGVDQAWKLGARRVWLHTCNLDGPHALANYRKRGFRVYMEHREPMPERYQ